MVFFFFFFNDTATTEIYTLSLHDALPILDVGQVLGGGLHVLELARVPPVAPRVLQPPRVERSEEHTSELQSQSNLVCRLLLEKKKKTTQRVLQPNDNTHTTTVSQLLHTRL